MRIYAIGYFEGDTYKVKRVKANTVAEAHEKANLDTPIVRIQREEYKDIGMAIEALKRENHDGCDGCRYEENDELTAPCTSCKQNYTDKYTPMPKHDRDWIVGCIKHDGFIKTDRGDKANQIILEALKADRPRGEWIDENGTYYANCSKCSYQMDTHEERGYHNFCPNCGADMRGEDE